MEKEIMGLWNFFPKNGKVAIFVGVAIVLFGLVSYSSIPKENAPYIAYGIVNVSTPYTGVSASDMNDLVTEKLEAKLKNITGLDSYSSTSTNGLSNITLEFQPDTNMVKAMSDVRSKVSEAKAELPSDLDADPIITEIDSALTPFFTIILSGNFSPVELYDFAKQLEKNLERVNGVSKISISGGAERQMVVELQKNKMEALGISIDEVVGLLRNTNRDTPVGDLEMEEKKYIIRFEGKVKTVKEVENLVVKNLQKSAQEPNFLVTLKDIATVKEEGKKDPSITRFGNKENTPENAIFLSISRNNAGDIFSVDKRTRESIEKFSEKNFPKNLSIHYGNEVLPNIQKSFNEVFRVGYEAIFIVMLVIFIFVGVVEGIVSSLIIPITVLSTIGILYLTGSSLNFMTNFSMILALGILVDNAIVIVQGTYAKMRTDGTSALESALHTVEDFKAPLISGTLTTLAVFLPLLSLPGVLGQYLAFIPITVSIALASSLFIALFLISAYTAGILNWFQKRKEKKISHPSTLPKEEKKWNPILKLREKIDFFIEHTYANFLKKILQTRFVRLGLLLTSFFLLFLSAQLPISSEQFPAGDSEYLTVEVEKPVGTVENAVLKDVVELENFLLSLPETKHISTTITNEKASVSVELLTKEEREDKNLRMSMDLEKEINTFLPTIKDAQTQLSSQQKGPPSESPVAFRVVANDANAIEDAKILTQNLTEMMKTVEGTASVKNNIKEIPGEFRFVVNREKALRLGIPPDSIANLTRSMVNGTTATTITRSGQDIDIIVRYEDNAVKTIEDIKNIPVLSLSGSKIPLSEIISEKKYSGVESIFREDGSIAFTISAFLGEKLNGEKGNAAEITKNFQEKLKEEMKKNPLPSGVEVLDAGESAENEDLNKALAVGGLSAILLMYFVVFLQFRSFLQPIIILQTIIFAQMGVNLGLFLFDIPKSLAYTLGLITLFGIIVNHTIILIDRINKNRAEYGENMTYEEVIHVVVEGCKSRFHPVIMTGIATIAGLVPLLSVDEFWYGLASTIIYGLLTATFLVFLVTPATYVQLEKEKWKTFLAVIIMIVFLVLLSQVL